MKTWTAPREGTWHFAKGQQPHWYEDCGDWCASVGWKGWKAKDVVVDLDSDPNDDPGRFGRTAPG
jgi:uncharacterized protein CbrC (UPF0167 family)